MTETIWLQEVVENEGNEWIFYPKFYCELNSIELLWAHVKRYLRSKCSFSYPDLQRAYLPQALNDVPIAYLRGYRDIVLGIHKVIAWACRTFAGLCHAQIMWPPSDPARPPIWMLSNRNTNSVTLEYDNLVHIIISDFLSCLVLLAYAKPRFL